MDRAILDVLLVLILLTTAVTAVIVYRDFNRQPLYLKWLAIMLSLSFLCDVGSVVLRMQGVSPNISSSFYYLLSMVPICFFFYHAIQFKGMKPWLIIICVIYCAFAVLNFLSIQKISVNSYSQLSHALIILCLCIVYFYKLIKELPTQQLHRLPLFWIVAAFFFSYAGKLVVYTATHYLIHFVRDNLIIVWTFHNFLSIIGNLLIAYGAWLNHKQLKSTSLSL